MSETRERDWVTIAEASRLLGISRTAIYRAIDDGKLHPMRSEVYHGRGPVRLSRAEVLVYAHKPPGGQPA